VTSSQGFLEPKGLRVTVDRVIYNPEARTPADRPHCFIYVITIHNGSEHAVTIKGRKWVVTNDRGEVSALEGDGVVGQTPTINPGQKFTYNSFHLLDSKTAEAAGSYVGMDDLGRKVLTRIPPFQMVVPEN
jgi:ApaG protein